MGGGDSSPRLLVICGLKCYAEGSKKGGAALKLSEKILCSRKRAGLSQEALAAKLGLSRQAVSKWETGESQPETAKLAALAAALGVSVDWLLSEDGSEEAREVSGDRADGLPGVLRGAAGRWGWLAGVYLALAGLFMGGMGVFLYSSAVRSSERLRSILADGGVSWQFDAPGSVYYDIAHDKSHVFGLALIVLGCAVLIGGSVMAVVLRRRARR